MHPSLKYGLVNFEQLIKDAQNKHYCLLHINCINFDWIKTSLIAANESRSLIILAVSDFQH